MSGSLVFVHGTGGRSPGLNERWSVIVEQATACGVDANLVRADWGDHLGAPLDNLDVSLPIEAAPDAEMVSDTDSAAAWELLLDDPLFELRLLAEAPRKGPKKLKSQIREDVEVLLSRVTNAGDGDGAEILARCGVTVQELEATADAVETATESVQAARIVGSAHDTDFTTAVARALVAMVLAARRGPPFAAQAAVAYDRDLRVALVDHLAQTMVPGKDKGRLGDWAKRKISRFVVGRVASATVDRRQSAMGLAGPFVADILFYQRRGEQIRSFVAGKLAGMPKPVVALGHSLGGVILCDLLTAPDAPHADLLVTVGSQAPLFYAIDALEYLRRDQPASPFMPWLNIYDPNDLLAFCATRVFSESNGLILDVPIDANVPFPEAHGAYFDQEAFWKTIATAWPQV